MVRCEIMRRTSGCLDPSPRYTFLVSVDKFCPDSLRGDSAVHFAVKGLSVHSGLTQCGWRGGGLTIIAWGRQARRISAHPNTSFFLSESQITDYFSISKSCHMCPPPFFLSPLPSPAPTQRKQATLIWHHDILKHSSSWYGISPRLPCNRSRQLKHQPGTHFSISPLCLGSFSPPTPPRLTFSGGKYLTACYWVPCAVWHGLGCGRDMYIDKAVLLRVAADILR